MSKAEDIVKPSSNTQTVEAKLSFDNSAEFLAENRTVRIFTDQINGLLTRGRLKERIELNQVIKATKSTKSFDSTGVVTNIKPITYKEWTDKRGASEGVSNKSRLFLVTTTGGRLWIELPTLSGDPLPKYLQKPNSNNA